MRIENSRIGRKRELREKSKKKGKIFWIEHIEKKNCHKVNNFKSLGTSSFFFMIAVSPLRR